MNLKLPKGEIVWVRYCDAKGVPVFVLTSKELRDCYYLYEANEDGSLKKLGKARTPPELESKFAVNEKLRGRT